MFSGNASPAETEIFKFLNPSKLFDVVKSKMAENIVGTAKKVVTLNSFNNLETTSGVGLSGSKIVVAPTDIGKVIALPNPYAKNNFATEKIMSFW